ncbi:MAG: EamA family transporter [candidate division Zixibacteria bacterium]|nr:EamA family transporter [candidate division Zixibacteria bacterium]
MAILIYTLLCLIWGSTWMAIKVGLEDSPPLWSAGLRFVIAGLMVLVISRFRSAKFPRSWKELGKVAIPGIFMYGLSYMLVYRSEVYIDSALTAVLFASFPFFVAGISHFMLREESLNLWGWVGLVIGFLGTAVVSYDSLLQSRFVFLGTLLVLLAAAASAYGTVYIRARLKEYDIAVMASIQMILGALIIVLTAFIFEPLNAFRITFKSVTALFYLAVFGTVVAFLGYYWLLKRLRAIIVSQIGFITPIIALILGYFFMSERLSFRAGIGSLLILAGVFLVVRRGSK